MMRLEITAGMIIAILLGMGIIVGFFIWTNMDTLIEKDKIETMRQKQSRIDVLADFISHTFSDKLNTVQQIADNSLFQEFLFTDQANDEKPFGISKDLELDKRRNLQTVLYYNPIFSGIGLFLPNGDVYLAEPYTVQQNLTDKNFSFRDWYEGALTTNLPYVSETYITQYTDQKTVAMSAPIINGNDTVGIVQATLDLQDMDAIVDDVSLSNEAEIYIVDQNKNIVLTGSNQAMIDLADFSLHDVNSYFENHDFMIGQSHGEEVLLLRSQITAGSHEWYVYFIQPYDLAFGTILETQNLSMFNMSLIFAMLIIVGLIVFYFVRKNQLITFNLQKSNNSLQDFMSALNESSIVAITDSQGTITYANDKFCDISKYSRDELLGQNHRLISSGFHSKSFFEKMWQQITSGKTWKGDIKNKAKDGSYYWGRATITPIIGSDGKPSQYIAINTDITNQKNLEESLKNALDIIKKADILKEEFSAMISHELKTPLTPIKGYCEMLLEQNVMGGLTLEQKEAIHEIDRNANRLEVLISDILDAQKLDMGKMSFNKEQFDLNVLFHEFQNDMSSLFLAKNAELVISSKVNSITSDKHRIRQVLDNLVKNSLDFIPEKNGRVKVQVIPQNTNAVFSVQDNGIGIPIGAQQHIFKKFYQVDTSHSRKHGGTGLGLVVSKGLIEQLGGKIWFESQEGVGTTFYFSIPIK